MSKKMKCLLCTLLAFLLCAGALCFPASAIEDEDRPWYPNETVLAKFGTSRGYDLGIYVVHSSPSGSLVKIGPYCFRSEYYYPELVGVYAYKGNEIHTLQDAYQEDLVDIHETVDQLRAYLKSGMPGYDGYPYFCYIYRFGDANLDEEVNLQDVLFVQKGIAGIIDLSDINYYISGLGSLKAYFLGDYNDDGEVNMEDVLSIQKYIAKFEK